jgi:peptide/nickel transport system permease protein
VLSSVALGAVAVPEFVIAGLFIALLAFGLGWFPAVSLVPLGGSPLDDPVILVLPVLTVATFAGMFGLRLVRAVVADAAVQPAVEAARLAGVAEHRVIRRHLLPTVIGPIVQVLALIVPFLVGGTVVVERVFGYPGLGSLLVDQINARDVTVVETIGLLMASSVILTFLVADVVADTHDRRLVRVTA